MPRASNEAWKKAQGQTQIIRNHSFVFKLENAFNRFAELPPFRHLRRSPSPDQRKIA